MVPVVLRMEFAFSHVVQFFQLSRNSTWSDSVSVSFVVFCLFYYVNYLWILWVIVYKCRSLDELKSHSVDNGV